jgi:hypothetical protein
MLERLVEPPVFEEEDEEDEDVEADDVAAEDEFVALLTVIYRPIWKNDGPVWAGPSHCGSIQEH